MKYLVLLYFLYIEVCIHHVVVLYVQIIFSVLYILLCYHLYFTIYSVVNLFLFPSLCHVIKTLLVISKHYNHQ
jgi:hypothetical protein